MLCTRKEEKCSGRPDTRKKGHKEVKQYKMNGRKKDTARKDTSKEQRTQGKKVVLKKGRRRFRKNRQKE